MPTSNNTIVCVTHSADSYPVEWVMNHLREHGHACVRMNSDQYPLHLKMGGNLNQKGQEITLATNEWSLKGSQVSAIWHRKNSTCNLTDALEGDTLSQATRESECIKQTLLHGIKNAFWLDHPAIQQQAEDKWRQLCVAQSIGLHIPKTLFSNIPEQVATFYDECNGDIIAKMHTPLTVSMGKPSSFVYTSTVTKEHLADLASLKYSPMIFQQRINKQSELRIAYVDGHCFPAGIEAHSKTESHLTDWRKADPTLSKWVNCQIPDELTQKIRSLMNALHLKFGAIDFILDTHGQYQYLEVNPAGEWGMLEAELGLPISKQIALTLIKYCQ